MTPEVARFFAGGAPNLVGGWWAKCGVDLWRNEPGPVAVQSEKKDLVKIEDLALFGVSTESIALFNTPLSALFSSSRRTIHHPPPPVTSGNADLGNGKVPISGLGGFSA